MPRIKLLQESRADAGIFAPLIAAMERDSRFTLTIANARPWLDTGYNRPDWLIVLGDRRPMLEATIDAAYKGIPVAHIQGGDRSGTIDEPCRHAITRFANLHFPCTQVSADRLIRMGEEPWRIKVVGPLGIYAMPNAALLSKAAICEKLGLDAAREIVLVIQHPVSTQQEQAGAQMRATLEALGNWQFVIIGPNTDPGSDAIARAIEEWLGNRKGLYLSNLPYLDFISLLRASSVVVGNSSTGLYEAPLFGVPAVNIGTRQQGRERGANVVQCEHDARMIRIGIEQAMRVKRLGIASPFNSEVDGVTVIMDTIANQPVDERLLQKRLTY